MTKTELSIHPVQAKILRDLLFKLKARFVELNSEGLTNDHFTFHITQLVESGLVQKDKGNYTLTIPGKEFANRLDTDKVVFEKQAKLGALIVATRKVGKTNEYLIQQRLKQPYFGFHGFMTGKVRWGETLKEAADREFLEESGLTGVLTLVGVKHKMDYNTEDNLLEDKYFFVFRAEYVQGNFTADFEGGKNIWLSREKILNLPNLFDGVEESIDMISQDSLVFSESKYKVMSY